MKALLLALLAGCTADLPEPAHIYECNGTFYCDGRDYGLTDAHGCADDQDEADTEYYVRALELTAEAKCTQSRIYYVCIDTGKYCTK